MMHSKGPDNLRELADFHLVPNQRLRIRTVPVA
jgi:hypothetical protein